MATSTVSEPLYEADILAWSEQQAELLRRRAANALDWDNLAEEIGDVGLSQLRAVELDLILALLHDLKAGAWPLSRDVDHWRAEARGHRDDARRHFSPSMAQPHRYRETLFVKRCGACLRKWMGPCRCKCPLSAR